MNRLRRVVSNVPIFLIDNTLPDRFKRSNEMKSSNRPQYNIYSGRNGIGTAGAYTREYTYFAHALDGWYLNIPRSCRATKEKKNGEKTVLHRNALALRERRSRV